MQEVLDEVIEKVAALTSAERRELIQFLQEEECKSRIDGGKNPSRNF